MMILFFPLSKMASPWRIPTLQMVETTNTVSFSLFRFVLVVWDVLKPPISTAVVLSGLRDRLPTDSSNLWTQAQSVHYCCATHSSVKTGGTVERYSLSPPLQGLLVCGSS